MRKITVNNKEYLIVKTLHDYRTAFLGSLLDYKAVNLLIDTDMEKFDKKAKTIKGTGEEIFARTGI